MEHDIDRDNVTHLRNLGSLSIFDLFLKRVGLRMCGAC